MAKADKKKVRKLFRDAVFSRDRYTCQVCGRKWAPTDCAPEAKLVNAHHITDRTLLPNGGYVKENGITVCDVGAFSDGSLSCHMQVEQWHITGGDPEAVPEHLRPDALYEKVGSSYDRAVRASERLD